MEGDHHEDRYMIQNTLRHVGKHWAWVYILDLLDDAEGKVTAEMKTGNGFYATRRPNEGCGDLHV